MSQYQEYKPKKPRNFTAVVLGALTALLIVILMIAYGVLASHKQESSIKYPEKISLPAGETHTLFQMEENIISDKIVVDEAVVDDIEDMLFAEPAPDDKIVVAPTKPITQKKPAVKETYKPIFVATPTSPQWQVNAVSANIDPDRPMIAIVIDDLGIDKHRTQQTIDLPAPLNLSFLPYPTHLQEQTAKAMKAGHELLVHMPMEPSNLAKNNPGPKALLLKNGKDINLENLRSNLNKFDGYIGVNNHMGSRFTADYNAMGPILEELKRRGLLFLDSRTIGNSKAGKLASELDLPFASRDVFLDHDPSRAKVDASLAKTLRMALKNGTAIAIGHPKDNTIAALKAWIPKVKAQGVQIVPLTAITYKRMGYPSPIMTATKIKAKTNDNNGALPFVEENALAPITTDSVKDVKQSNHIQKEEQEIKQKQQQPAKSKPVTVTVGDDKSYDAIIWSDPAPTAY